jgi:hypothetical protein
VPLMERQAGRAEDRAAFHIEGKNGAIISTREKGGTRETLALPLFCGEAASVLSDFPAPALLSIRLK